MNKEIVLAFYSKPATDSKWYHKLGTDLIKLWTKSDYFHVETMINKKWLSADPVGITISPIRKFSKKYTYIKINVQTCREQDEFILDWLNSIDNEPYDWKAIFFRQFINVGKQKRNSWICSEIASKILQLYLVKPFVRIESSSMSPGDMYKALKDNPNAKEVTAKELNEQYKLV